MKEFHFLGFLALLASLTSFVNGDNSRYNYDASCTSDMTAFIDTALNKAMDMSDAAFTQVSGTPTSAMQTVLNYLFDPGVLPNYATRFGIRVFGAAGVSRFRGNKDLGLTPGTALYNEMIIYCDESRFQRRWGIPITYYDPHSRQFSRTKGCSGGSFSPIEMYTQETSGHWFQLQICPYFLASSIPAEYKSTTSLDSSTFWKKKIAILTNSLLRDWGGRFTAIDAFSLFDATLLHELTHANANYPTLDTETLTGDAAYGWNNCKAISKIQTVGGAGITGSNIPNLPKGPELNADTWTLIGSIAWAMQHNEITTMNADGTWT